MFEDIYQNQKNTEELWQEFEARERDILGINGSFNEGFFGSPDIHRESEDIEDMARGAINYFEDAFVVEDEKDEQRKQGMIDLLKEWLEKVA